MFDCPYAGRLVRTLDEMLAADADVVAFGTCGEAEVLPWGRLDLPADLFTVCLLSPIQAALSFYRAQGTVISEMSLGALRLVTGNPKDSTTPLGELVSIFTAVTDAIAWSSFEQRIFWRLFREDVALANISRNFLLAARILHTFGLHATSRPALPPTHAHHLWDNWDSTLELFLLRLAQAQSPPAPRPCFFFDEQMVAFSVWLRFQPPFEGQNPELAHFRERPSELAIVLQGLLQPNCILQALHLLACFVDLGQWAVQLTLFVGARPYLTKLLSHDDAERPEVTWHLLGAFCVKEFPFFCIILLIC
jgi:regulatory associated protein of mTOR